MDQDKNKSGKTKSEDGSGMGFFEDGRKIDYDDERNIKGLL